MTGARLLGYGDPAHPPATGTGESEGPLRFFLGYEIMNGFVRNARRKWTPTNRHACLEAMLEGLTRKEGI